MSALAIESAEVRTAPYLHATIGAVFEPAVADRLAEELCGIDTWQLNRGDFFEQYELDLRKHGPAAIRELLDAELLASLRRRVGDLLMTELRPDVKVIAHRMTPGQGIGLHNDEPRDDAETHRLVVNLGAFEGDQCGGHIVLFAEPSLDAIDRVLRPTHNSGLCFEASADSHHAVTPVQQGRRHSIVFSFWRADGDQVSSLDAVSHSGGSLGDHLRGTYQLLHDWGAPEHVCLGGLLHSGYGTEYLAAGHEPDAEARRRVSDVIGAEAERLVWLFSTCRRSSISDALASGRLQRHHDGAAEVVDRATAEALLLIDLADTVEQLPRVPVDAHELDHELRRFEALSPSLPAAGLAALRTVVADRR